GTILAIGAGYNDGNGNNSGHVRVFKNLGGNWTQVGSDLDGTNAGDNFGASVSLTATGDKIAIGAYNYVNNGVKGGAVFVYDLTASLSTENIRNLDKLSVFPNPAHDFIAVES